MSSLPTNYHHIFQIKDDHSFSPIYLLDAYFHYWNASTIAKLQDVVSAYISPRYPHLLLHLRHEAQRERHHYSNHLLHIHLLCIGYCKCPRVYVDCSCTTGVGIALDIFKTRLCLPYMGRGRSAVYPCLSGTSSQEEQLLQEPAGDEDITAASGNVGKIQLLLKTLPEHQGKRKRRRRDPAVHHCYQKR